MSAIPFPCLIPARYQQQLETLEKESNEAKKEIKSLQAKRLQIHKQDYLAVKVNFVVLMALALIKFSPFGSFISNECTTTLMILSIAFTKPIINFFKPLK